MIHLKHLNNKMNSNANILEERSYTYIWEKESLMPKHVNNSSKKLYQIINYHISRYLQSFLSVQNMDMWSVNMTTVQNVTKNSAMNEMNLIWTLEKNTLLTQKNSESLQRKKYMIKIYPSLLFL